MRGGMQRGCGPALLLAAAALLAPPAHAACESGLAERMQARLYPARTLDHALAACKAWPMGTAPSP